MQYRFFVSCETLVKKPLVKKFVVICKNLSRSAMYIM